MQVDAASMAMQVDAEAGKQSLQRNRSQALWLQARRARCLTGPELQATPWDAAVKHSHRMVLRSRSDTIALQQHRESETWYSRKTQRIEALRNGRDRHGHGWVSWQVPLAFLFSLMSVTWGVSGALDSFQGQTTCERPENQLKIECNTYTFAQLLNRTLDRHAHDPDGSHPGNISAGFIVLSVVGLVATLLIAKGVFTHHELHLRTNNAAKDNTGSLLCFAAAMVLELVSLVSFRVLSARAPTAYSRLEELHNRGEITHSNFDPATAAAYAHAGGQCLYLVSILMFFPALGQYRRLFGCGRRRREFLDMMKRSKNDAHSSSPAPAPASASASASSTVATDTTFEYVLFPVEQKTVRKRKHQVKLFCAAWLHLVAGASFYRFTAENRGEFQTMAQAVYFTFVTCTTIGYGDMSPSNPWGRVFLVTYSMAGIVLVGKAVRELGELLLTASEAPAYWVMRAVMMRVHPTSFPGISEELWGRHGISTSPDTSRNARTVWVGNIPSSLATRSVLTKIFEDIGNVERVDCSTDLATQERQHADLESQWALVTMSDAEAENDLVAKITALEGHDFLGQDGVLLVLPAQTNAVCRHMLETGAIGLAKLQFYMAVCLWLTMLFGVGPLYSMLTHSWTYEESLYFTYITMTTIGFGDFYPNSDGARYAESVEAMHHQVYVWCMGIVVIVVSLSSFSFVYAAVQDSMMEERDNQEQAALAQQRAELEEESYALQASSGRNLNREEAGRETDQPRRGTTTPPLRERAPVGSRTRPSPKEAVPPQGSRVGP